MDLAGQTRTLFHHRGVSQLHFARSLVTNHNKGAAADEARRCKNEGNAQRCHVLATHGGSTDDHAYDSPPLS
jgi:hypothetical protein